VFDYNGDKGDLLNLRTTEDVFMLALSTQDLSYDWRDLRWIANLIQESESLGNAIELYFDQRRKPKNITYRIVARKEGKHQYRRMDLEEAIRKGLERRFGNQWNFVEEGGALELWANIIGSRFLLGLRLSSRTMRHRDYKKAHFPGSLRPSIAAAMIELLEPEARDICLDPMCGGGTIVSEFLLSGQFHVVAGGDLDFNLSEMACQNLPSGKKALIGCWDATSLPFAANSISKIASNLPFGKKIGTQEDIEILYPKFVAEMERLLKPGGKAVLLSSQYELLKDIIRKFPKIKMVRGYAISILGEWGRLYLVEKM
jgi:23S rRNA G2445 N2-methylase RlmL